MAKFKNKITGEIVEANEYAGIFAFTHNSNFEPVEEKVVDKKPEPKTIKKLGADKHEDKGQEN